MHMPGHVLNEREGMDEYGSMCEGILYSTSIYTYWVIEESNVVSSLVN